MLVRVLAILVLMIATYLALAQIGVGLFFKPQGGRRSPAPQRRGTTHHPQSITLGQLATPHDTTEAASPDR